MDDREVVPLIGLEQYQALSECGTMSYLDDDELEELVPKLIAKLADPDAGQRAASLEVIART